SRSRGGDGPLEDHGDVVGRPGLEVDGRDRDELPPFLTQLIELRGGVRVQAVVLAADVDDFVLPLGHSARSFLSSVGTATPNPSIVAESSPPGRRSKVALRATLRATLRANECARARRAPHSSAGPGPRRRSPAPGCPG